MDAQPPPRTEPASVILTDLTKRFGAFVAVDRVSLSIAHGEVFGLIGPNGAGKTTLMKMLTTLLPPTSGSATVAGFDLLHQAHIVRRHIGYVPQLVSADGSLTGYENMLLSARLYGIPRKDRETRIREALATMGLTDFAGHIVQRYSGGMIRRLEVAQSMLHHPTVLFMDEPSVGLDPTARETVWRHVLDLKRSSNMTLVLTTHYMEEVDELCDRVALMVGGHIVAIGTPAELKEKVGPGASLEDVFDQLTATAPETENERSYVDVKRARGAARG